MPCILQARHANASMLVYTLQADFASNCGEAKLATLPLCRQRAKGTNPVAVLEPPTFLQNALDDIHILSRDCPCQTPGTLEDTDAYGYGRLPSGASVKPDRSWTPDDNPTAKTMLSTILVAIRARKLKRVQEVSCLSVFVLSEGPPTHRPRQQHIDPQSDCPTSASAQGSHVQSAINPVAGDGDTALRHGALSACSLCIFGCVSCRACTRLLPGETEQRAPTRFILD